jgi:hypothetical protein
VDTAASENADWGTPGSGTITSLESGLNSERDSQRDSDDGNDLRGEALFLPTSRLSGL